MLTASSRDTFAVGLQRVADISWSTSVGKKNKNKKKTKNTDDEILCTQHHKM